MGPADRRLGPSAYGLRGRHRSPVARDRTGAREKRVHGARTPFKRRSERQQVRTRAPSHPYDNNLYFLLSSSSRTVVTDVASRCPDRSYAAAAAAQRVVRLSPPCPSSYAAAAADRWRGRDARVFFRVRFFYRDFFFIFNFLYFPTGSPVFVVRRRPTDRPPPHSAECARPTTTTTTPGSQKPPEHLLLHPPPPAPRPHPAAAARGTWYAAPPYASDAGHGRRRGTP